MNAAVPLATARILDVTEEQYQADPCDVPSLSQSLAHILLTKSPLHAWQEHPKFGGMPATQDGEADDQGEGEAERDTEALTAGKIIHKLLLGKGCEIQVVKADNFRTKAARETRDAATAAGRTPIIERKYDAIVASVLTIRKRLADFGILFDGESEVALEWDEMGGVGPVRCRARMDHIRFRDGVVYDVKKIRAATRKQCEKHMVEYGYHTQRAAYVSALEKLRPELVGRVDMVFLFMEVEPPYAILPGRCDGILREIGENRWSRAVHVWERCLLQNRWPSCAQDIVQLTAPPWAMRQDEEELV